MYLSKRFVCEIISLNSAKRYKLPNMKDSILGEMMKKCAWELDFKDLRRSIYTSSIREVLTVNLQNCNQFGCLYVQKYLASKDAFDLLLVSPLHRVFWL